MGSPILLLDLMAVSRLSIHDWTIVRQINLVRLKRSFVLPQAGGQQVAELSR